MNHRDIAEKLLRGEIGIEDLNLRKPKSTLNLPLLSSNEQDIVDDICRLLDTNGIDVTYVDVGTLPNGAMNITTEEKQDWHILYEDFDEYMEGKRHLVDTVRHGHVR